MEKTKKLITIFAIALAVLMVAYIAFTTMPIFKYTFVDETGTEQNVSVSLSQYLWLPYNYAELTGDVLPSLYKDALGAKYNITSTIGFPAFSYVGALISILVILIFKKYTFSVFFPLIWSLGSLIGYFISPFISLIIPGTKMIHLIVFAATLIVSLAAFFMAYLPQIAYNRAHREKY